MAEVPEDVLVQAFIPEPTIECFAERVLGRLAWGNVMPVEIAILDPAEHGVRGELCAVVRDDELGFTTSFDQAVQLSNDPAA